MINRIKLELEDLASGSKHTLGKSYTSLYLSSFINGDDFINL
jgi:hypothetical protein